MSDPGFLTLDRASSTWRRLGRAPYASAGFVYGQTIPTTENVGVIAGSTLDTYSGSNIINGSNDANNPTLVANKHFPFPIKVESGYIRFYNCYFSNNDEVAPANESALLYCMHANVKGVTVERCTFDPTEAGAHWNLNGITGHHITVRRCLARRVVDFVGAFNTNSSTLNATIEGNLVEWLCYFYDPIYGVVHPSDYRTHNDAIQCQGGQGLTVRGNVFNGLLFWPDGVTPPTDRGLVYEHLAHQGILCQQNVQKGTPINPVIDRNWIYGFQNAIVCKTANNNTGTGYDVTLTGNRMDDRRRYYTTDSSDYYGTPGGKAYDVRVDSVVTVNGISYTPSDSAQYPSDAPSDNRYFNDSRTTGAQRRGQLVLIRRDTFTGSG